MIVRYGYDYNTCVYYALLANDNIVIASNMARLVYKLNISFQTLRNTSKRADILKVEN